MIVNTYFPLNACFFAWSNCIFLEKIKAYDIVTANILGDVLVPLTPVVPRFIKKDGIYITSGIIEGKEELVAETMKASGFEVIDISAQGEWRSVTGRKK